ncbi:uncharacterized protein BX663DRAFT_539272 [Cokeromyces recurvatus]|uniref:uncharacterized protein n=1 Tax=Cokeromyces recurvatus TaxID=90255 RepID=UPI00221F5221|nr:uncharacterized protein BX663DRAFT_539272 [Cokeromyces recurvatus]KAI7907858.1 hypothetical protein BX663DRAFT_539272 [Cokeromyces recurvatus]
MEDDGIKVDDLENNIEVQSITNNDCPCQYILDSNNLSICSLCQSPIPIIQQLLAEKSQYETQIEQLQAQLSIEQTRIDDQLQSIANLNDNLQNISEQLDTKTAQFQRLQNDMEMLNDKYVDEIERVAEIQHSKDMVESELEDLSRRLFEEANGMVAHEKREKHNLQIAQRHLENQLRETRERLGAEQMQLQELRKRMEDMASHDNLVLQQTTALPPPKLTGDTDALLLDEFKEFVKTGTKVSLKKIHMIPFMKACQEEDVEACLRFGPNNRLSIRKVNEAIVMNTCFIEEAPTGFQEEQTKKIIAGASLKISATATKMWERLSNASNNSSSYTQTTVFNGCQACGRSDGTSLPYRFRISYFDDWACIDRFCRDRLVAVCEFYVFIRNIRQGLYNNRDIQDLYHEAMRLRLQMFYARMGALPLTLRNTNINEPKVTTSESSPLPKSTNNTKPSYRRGSLTDVRKIP